MTKQITDKLVKARTQLILDKPFLGNLVLRLPLIAADKWCVTTATDAKNFYYNPEFINGLDIEQTKFVLIHEALHCALTHFARRGERKKHLWDLACDFAINPLIVKEGFKPPAQATVLFQYEGKTSEEIYLLINDNTDILPMDQHLYDEVESKDNQENLITTSLAQKPKPLNITEIQNLKIKWQKDLASSATLARQNGHLSAIMEKIVDFYLQPQIDWQDILAQYLYSFARDNFSYLRPKKYGNAIFPTLKSSTINLVIAIDTSSSVNQRELDQFIAEINGLKSNLNATVNLVFCDDKLSINSPMFFNAWEELKFPNSLQGGGGTNFNPVFDYVDGLDVMPNALVYFTDADGIFPQVEPNYPVIWIVKGAEKVPWGRRCQL